MLIPMLQLLPFVCKHMPISVWNELLGILNPKRNNLNWFHDLGSLASRAVLRWWQNAICDIVDNLVQAGCLSSLLKDIIGDRFKRGISISSSLLYRLLRIVR